MCAGTFQYCNDSSMRAGTFQYRIYDVSHSAEALMNALSDMFQSRGIQRQKIKSQLEQKNTRLLFLQNRGAIDQSSMVNHYGFWI